MHFSTLFVTISLAASAVLAGPISDGIEPRGALALEPVRNIPVPLWSVGTVSVSPTKIPAGAVHASTGNTLSLRSEHNELEKRTRTPATLILCYGLSCSGGCYGYSLADKVPYQCYRPTTGCYKSLYVQANSGLNYGVYAANNCAGTLIQFVNTCYNLTPQGNTFYTN